MLCRWELTHQLHYICHVVWPDNSYLQIILCVSNHNVCICCVVMCEYNQYHQVFLLLMICEICHNMSWHAIFYLTFHFFITISFLRSVSASMIIPATLFFSPLSFSNLSLPLILNISLKFNGPVFKQLLETLHNNQTKCCGTTYLCLCCLYLHLLY